MLQPLAFIPLPLGSIHPRGWLANQLRIQADGLSGHLDEFWPDVARSGWIGGDAEGWERGPYWLDGVVPLAFALNDENLKAKVRRWIDHILTHQQPDGWLGPTRGADKYDPHDPWPVFVAMKAMWQYWEATKDSRIVPAIARFLRRLDGLLDQRPLFHWGRFRWADAALTILGMHDLSPDPWLIELARKLQHQGYDWGRHFAETPFKSKVTAEMLAQFKAESGGDWGNDRYMASHGVNVAMGLKAPAVAWRFTGDPSNLAAPMRMLEQIDHHHGQVSGMFSCDEHLAGLHPSQGTELCAVVEMMYSLETLLSIIGDPRFGDRLEQVAFNALPATFSPDMWTHQYVQQCNQVVCRVSDERMYTNNGPEANLFGIEPNYGCCTANLSQGWPKFAGHLWMRSRDRGLAAMSYAPCEVRARIGDSDVRVVVETSYPFGEEVIVRVEANRPAVFPLHLRVPAWADSAECRIGDTRVDAQPASFLQVRRIWDDVTEVQLRFPASPKFVPRAGGRTSVSAGPLVFALPVPEEWRLLRGTPPRADWEVHPTGAWNYALRPGVDAYSRQPPGSCPFSPDGAPVRLTVEGARVDGWTVERNAAAEPPASPVHSDHTVERLTLIPYGCTSLRVAEFPVLG